MKLESFKSGVWKKQFQYKSFSPSPVNHEWSWEDTRINLLLEQATRALGELNAFSFIVPDVDLFIETHVVKEANASSRIEGTRTEMDEALMPEEAVKPENRDEWREVRNYIDAINQAIGELKHLPLSNRLLRSTHATLMRGTRGDRKQPGEFRSSQNWIGGSGPIDAAFVPPHPDEVPDLMSDLEKFLHNSEIAVPDLIRAAIAHYHFETIHPFNDGNGRIGRLLITLFLVSRNVLAKPSLYLSDFFERNRSAYIDALMRVRTANDLNHWVRFFLAGVLEVSSKGRETFQKILALRTEAETKCLSLGRRGTTARRALDVLFHTPIIYANSLAKALGITRQTANLTIKDLEKLELLVEITGKERWRLYKFEPYLSLFLR